MKLVSYKMPSQILCRVEDHLDYITLACLLTTLPICVHAYQLVNIFILFCKFYSFLLQECESLTHELICEQLTGIIQPRNLQTLTVS